MKTTATPYTHHPPAPKPEARLLVTLDLTQAEAKLLYDISNLTVVIPASIAQAHHAPDVVEFLRKIQSVIQQSKFLN